MTYRIFTHSDAVRILPDIMRLTSRYREEMEHVWRTLDGDSTATDLREADLRLHVLKREWSERIKELGAIPVRLWEVCFDTGDGFFFSWRIGEHDVDHVHRPTSHRFPQRMKIRRAA